MIKKSEKFEKKSKQTKIFYRCNKVTQRKKLQCSTGPMILCLAYSQAVEIHKTLCAQDHIPRVYYVSSDARAQIDLMFHVTKSLTSQAILENLYKVNDKIKLSNSLNNEDKPLILIVGSSDFNRVFHPIGLACCSRETQLVNFKNVLI